MIISNIIIVSIITLIERKLIGRIQRRTSCDKIYQPFIDALKLILKMRYRYKNNLYYLSSLINLIFTILILCILPNIQDSIWIDLNIKNNFIWYILLLSYNFYPILYSAISSNNKYSLISAIRAIKYIISYEIILTSIALWYIYYNKSLSILEYNLIYEYIPIMIILYIIMSIESNRLPYDLIECESELVAGYIIEYSAIEFTLIYLSEYIMLLINSIILSLIFYPYIYIYLISFIFIRALLPRYKLYDVYKNSWFHYLLFVMFFFLYSFLLI